MDEAFAGRAGEEPAEAEIATEEPTPEAQLLLAAGRLQGPAMSTRVQEKAIARRARSDPTSRIIGA